MPRHDRHVIVLAAGKGSRMRSLRPKVLHSVAGRPLIDHVLKTARSLEPTTITVVVGHKAELVQQTLASHHDLLFAHQENQNGTGHAVLQAKSVLNGMRGNLVVLSGDVPCLRKSTLAALIEKHEAEDAAATLLTANLDRPYGYGRIIRSADHILGVVEHADASPEQRLIKEVNAGVYVFDLEPLFESLEKIPRSGPKQERYLPALVPMYRRRQLKVLSVGARSPHEIRGINSQAELAEMNRIVRQTKNEELMALGVTIEDPATTYIDDDVTVGADTVIRPGVILQGRTTVGKRCELQSWVRVTDGTIGDDVTIRNCCVITESHLNDGVVVGPFAHLRPGCQLDEKARVGNFVEMKKTVLGAGSKASHLSYLGDTTVGTRANVGAGTITCNYDGQDKNQTVIEDEVFIGSGSQLVAPVRLGRNSYVAAGSCITEDVRPGALGIARSRQENKEDWVEKKRKSE